MHMFFSHLKLAIAMLTPFMVNYFAAMSLWKTKYSTEMVKKTFIFPLLNIFPQFGMKTQTFKKYNRIYCRGTKGRSSPFKRSRGWPCKEERVRETHQPTRSLS